MLGFSRQRSQRQTSLACVILAVLLAAPIGADDGEPRTKWLHRLDGRHFSADVLLTVDWGGGRVEQRRIAVFRDDEGGARERLLARFETPFDMRGLAILYLENDGRANDYFVYQPTLRRVRRVAESIARQDVYGVDLEYLGFGLALIEPTEVVDVQRVQMDGVGLVRLTERALQDNQRFDERIVWLDPATWIPRRTEHHRDGRLRMVARTLEVRDIQGVPTPTRAVFDRPDEGETVTLLIDSIDYDSPVPESFFSTMALLKGR